MSPVVGRGAECAGWFNTNAKRVTPKALEAFRQALPDARLYACSSYEQAERFADELVEDLPRILFCGGGDGTIVVLLNALKKRGVTKFPVIGLFKLGTGNGWPSAVNAHSYDRELERLPSLAIDPTTKRFHLCEVDGRICQFAGVGWDATLLDDYRKNLESRKQHLVAGGFQAKLSKGLGGYLYSLFRLTVPGELARAREGGVKLKLENIGEEALTLDPLRRRVPVPASQKILYEGPMSIGAAGTEPYWGSKFKAFPYALDAPGRMNFRVYDRHVLIGVNNMFHLWAGDPLPGMHDFWVTGVRLHLSKPMPYQMGGDVMETREVVDFKLAKETVDLIDWAY